MARPHAFGAVTSAELAERHRKWGGSVRYCLSSAAVQGDQELRRAIQRVNINELMTLLQEPDANPVSSRPVPEQELSLQQCIRMMPASAGVQLQLCYAEYSPVTAMLSVHHIALRHIKLSHHRLGRAERQKAAVRAWPGPPRCAGC